MNLLLSFRSKSAPLVILFLALPFFTNAQSVLKCGMDDATLIPAMERYFGNSRKSESARTSMGETLVYRLAIDVNYNTYLLYQRDKIRISEVVHEFIEKASKVFEKEINVRLVVTDLLIWDAPEPYPLINDNDYYNNIIDYWTTSRPGDRDCVVSLSTRSGWFYGGGRMCSSNFPGPEYTLLDVGLLCHELGHTLGSPHTHSCFWPEGPIDVCNTVEFQSSDCQAPFTDFVNGTIMSYCRSVMEFHPYCRELMRAYSEGKVQEVYFAMSGFSPVSNLPLTIDKLSLPEFSPAPAFSWRSTHQTDVFRFQVSYDAAFTRLAEDIVIPQPFYHSTQFAGGTYYVRVRAESGAEAGPWSASLPFEMPAFPVNRTPPTLLNPEVSDIGEVTTSFRNEPHADAYQVEIIDPYNGALITSYEGKTGSGAVQDIRFSSNYQSNQIRLRVRYGEEWSDWSAFPQNLSLKWGNLLSNATPLIRASASPLLSFQALNTYSISSGIMQHLEVSRDARFSTIAARDSIESNEVNQYRGNKFHFFPELDEKEQYFIRTRTRYGRESYSRWISHSLETGRRDTRFRYAGSLPRFSTTSTNFAETAPLSRFLVSGDRLYVYGNFIAGYYVTSNLRDWQEVTGRTTQGKVPSFYYAFGATPTGDAWMLHQPGNIAISKTDGTFEYTNMSEPLYLYEAEPAYITRHHGLFFKVPGVAIAHVFNGSLQILRQETFPSYTPVALAGGPDESIWALMQGGALYVFRDGVWRMHSQFPYWNAATAFCFAPDGTPWLYGNFGAAHFDGEAWKNNAEIKGVPVRKAVFDDKGQLWMASYRSNGPESYEHYALMKLKGEKLISYTDGLNFLREPFDLDFFKGNLVIMTTGGEVHTFEETHIQRFAPSSAYCHGEELTATVTSNSSFGSDNRFSVELVNRETGRSEKLIPSVEEGDQLTATVPDAVPEGIYTLRTVASDPELTSNESLPFGIYTNEKPSITTEAAGNFSERLSTASMEGYSYQWFINNEPVPGGTGPELEATRSGTYVLEASNEACTNRSDAIVVSLPDPGKLTLQQNTPNPFSDATVIAFYLPDPQHASLEIFDLNGRKIAVVKEDFLSQGWHEVSVDGTALSAGTYIYRLTTPNGKLSLKAVKR